MPRTLRLNFDSFDDRACAVCYFIILRKWLTRAEQGRLLLTACDCSCDFPQQAGRQPDSSTMQIQCGSAASETVDRTTQ